MIRFFSIPFLLIFFFSFCTKEHVDSIITLTELPKNRMSGITMVAPPEAFEKNPIPPIESVNAKWISLVPYAFTPQGRPNVYYDGFGQWWGETPAGLKESARLAHEKGLKIMLKPQVYIPNGWVGDFDLNSEEDWMEWEGDYRRYIMTMVNIAIENKIEMFCIGTEFKIAVHKREDFWRQLILDVRAIYSGKVLYSSNWDAYKNVEIWDAVDYIGVSAYFPLSDEITPTVDELSEAWEPIIKEMSNVSKKYNKGILFTEYGYLSVDQCAYRSWELEKKVSILPVNEQAQANALHALYKNMLDQDFWMGGFLWKWFPNDKGHEGYIPKDYTPQNKLSEEVVRDWYAKF